jgi:hypothetical protein
VRVLLTIDKVGGELDGAWLVTVREAESIEAAKAQIEREGWRVIRAEAISEDDDSAA